LTAKGWQQSDLASSLKVSEAAVSQWLSGEHRPRPPMLLRIAVALDAAIDKLLPNDVNEAAPLIAYRRKGQQVTTAFAEDEALDQSYALESIIKYLPQPVFRPREFSNPTLEYDNLERLATTVRSEIGLTDDSTFDWTTLVDWFHRNGATLIPVLWGARENHGNALHIFFPENSHTFIYINLDSHKLDFKFWLAHEMAHMLTPSLVGQEAGEDFADAFAGSVLFPQKLAAAAYREALNSKSPHDLVTILGRHAESAGVSLYTAYQQCLRLARAKKTPELVIAPQKLHPHRRALDKKHGTIRDELLKNSQSADEYLQIGEINFKTPFFKALRDHLECSGAGAAYIKRVLHSTLADAIALQGAIFPRESD